MTFLEWEQKWEVPYSFALPFSVPCAKLSPGLNSVCCSHHGKRKDCEKDILL